MNEFERDINDAAVSIGLQTGVSAEEIAIALMYFHEVFWSNIERLQGALVIVEPTLNNLTMSTEEIAIALNCIEPSLQTKHVHKMCFNRPRIIHQVSDRKPRHLVKKIIR